MMYIGFVRKRKESQFYCLLQAEI